MLLYEMLVGIPPFFHRNKHRMYFLIKESPVSFPDPEKHGIDISLNAKDLIKKLLDKNKRKRLGAKADVAEIIEHPFFVGMDVSKMLRREMVAPYRPQISDDLRYFD